MMCVCARVKQCTHNSRWEYLFIVSLGGGGRERESLFAYMDYLVCHTFFMFSLAIILNFQLYRLCYCLFCTSYLMGLCKYNGSMDLISSYRIPLWAVSVQMINKSITLFWGSFQYLMLLFIYSKDCNSLIRITVKGFLRFRFYSHLIHALGWVVNFIRCIWCSSDQNDQAYLI